MLAASYGSRRNALPVLIAMAMLGCGESLVTVDDSGSAHDAGAPGDDASADSSADTGPGDGGVDTEPPRVTSTRPRSGDELVALTRELEIRFSERMDETAGVGAVSVSTGGAPIALDVLTWSPEGDVLRIAPATSWPSGSRIDVEITDFRDLAGNALATAYELVFHTTDEGPPSVIVSTPAEGAVALDPATVTAIAIRFSEAMNPHVGGLALVGAGAIGARSWSSATELRVEVGGLAPGVSYRVALVGFEDVEGNALDGVPVLGDGAIDFTTAPDASAPTLVDSNPTNGQIDIDVLAQTEITLQFSEPMDSSIRTAMLDDGTALRTLTGNWTAGGTMLTFAATGRLGVDATHRLDLAAMRDVAGNVLDGTVRLDDGDLVFTTTAADESIPFVVFSSPAEGGTAPTRATSVDITFSEAMDPSVVAFELVSASGARALTGTWNAAGTRLSLPVAGAVPARTAFTIDLRAARDVTGNALDATHPYLGDGILSFSTGAATGEDCVDPLTTAEATPEGGGFVWELGRGAFQIADGAPSCGTVASVEGGVIEYVKTTADSAGGGTALRIIATSHEDIRGVQLEAFAGVCDPAAVGGGAAVQLACVARRYRWEQYLDVPAGTYYIWVSGDEAAFQGATVRIDEVPAVPTGEGCEDPYDVDAPFYSSPATGEHRWTLPFESGTSVEHGTSVIGDTAISCATRQGADSVVRVPKMRAGSILDVTVEPFPAGTLVGDRASVFVEARTTCEHDSGRVLSCTGGASLRRLQLEAPAGDVYLWLAANFSASNFGTGPLQRTDVHVREIDPGPGETCLTAIPIVPGASVPITPSATTRYFAPSCLDAPANVTWYRYTTTRELDLVGSIGTAPIAIVDPATGAEIACWDDASAFAIPRRAPAGTEVCIAVPSGSPITALRIGELDWQGITGTATDLEITRPEDDSGVPLSITSETWLALTPTQIHLGVNTDSSSTTTSAPAIVFAPRAGHDRATRVPVSRYSIGLAAVTAGEALYSIDETNAALRPSRLFRLINDVGTIEPAGTAWDPGSTYGAVNIRAMGRVGASDQLVIANIGSATLATSFFTASLMSSTAVLPAGTTSGLRDTVALAATADHVFVIASTVASGRTVYRLSRAAMGATPTPLAPAAELSFGSTNGSLAYDAVRDIVYFRTTGGEIGVHAIFGASTATPVYVGPVALIGRSSDHGLALDSTVPALVLFETSTDTNGAFAELR